MEDEIQGKIRKRGVSRTPVTTPKMTMTRYPVSEVATEFPSSERNGVVSARRLAATLWGMNEASVTSQKGSSCRKVYYCSDRALDSLPETETNTARQQFKDVCKGLSTAKELLKALTCILRLEADKHSSSANSLVLALRFELDRASAQVDHLAYAERVHRREMKCVMQNLGMGKDKVRRAAEVVATELEVERKLRKQAERVNRKLGRELTDGKAKAVKKELEMERRAEEYVLERVRDDRSAVLELIKTEAWDDTEKERQLAEAKNHFDSKKADFGKLKAELEAYMSDNTITEDAADHVDEADELEALRNFLRKTLGKACQNPNIESEEEGHGDDDHDSWESDTRSIELVLDGSDKWANSPPILHDDSKRSSFEVFKGRKSLSEKIHWASISLLKGS